MRTTKNKIKTPVTIRFKELRNGSQSIYLDIYHNGSRHYEFLKLYISPGKDPLTRIANENAMTAARAIQADRIKELTAMTAGIPCEHKESRMPITEYAAIVMQERIKTGMTYNHIKALINWMQKFEKRPTQLMHIDKVWIVSFTRWLIQQTVMHVDANDDTRRVDTTLKSATIKLRIAALNIILNHAVTHEYIVNNPMQYVPRSERVKVKIEEREYMTEEELNRLQATPNRNVIVRRAFLFSCYTGLRYSDIITLKWDEITMDHSGMVIKKTVIKSKKKITIPLGTKATNLLGEPGTGLVFPDLPTPRTIARYIKEWAEDANINKHITFHTARHTFATLLLTKGADIYTTSELLGHSSIVTTQIYAKIVDSKRKEAIKLLD